MTRQDEPLRRTRYLAVLVVAAVTLHAATARPQTLKVSSEIQAGLDRRWDDDVELRDEERKLTEIAKSFRQSKSLHLALMEVLKGLTEEDVRVLERALAVGEELQADMPVEDLVEDSPQELPGEDAGEELTGYRGELLVLDNINSSALAPSNLNSSEPTDNQFLPQLQKINREKLKEMRLETIKNQIMNTLWPVGTPPSFSSNSSTAPQNNLLRAIADKMKTQGNPFTPGNVYTEKIQSFYPSCEMPRNTDAELWSFSESMNLLFDLSYPTPLQGTQVNIVAAKLRLYKFSQGNESVGLDSCPPTESDETPNEHEQQYPAFPEEKMIRVSIYWYTRSLKKRRVKRKLLDSQMVSVYGESWTEWNIRGAVKAWRDSGRNFGLAVEVEDEDGIQLPTHNYFAPMNCSLEASTSRPIPGFLVARALAVDSGSNNTNHSVEQALRYDTLLFPMIDLYTIEFPESEKQNAVYYHKVAENEEEDVRKNSFKVSKKQQNTTSNVPVSVQTPSGAEKHKTRHQNHKHKDENHHSTPQAQVHSHKHLETVRRDDGDSIEEITWADDLDGHQLRKQIIVQKVIMKSQNNDQDNER